MSERVPSEPESSSSRRKRIAIIAGVAVLVAVGGMGWVYRARNSWSAMWSLHSSPEAQLADARERFIGEVLGEGQNGELQVVIGTLRGSDRKDLLVVLHTQGESIPLLRPVVIPERFDPATGGVLDAQNFILLKRLQALTGENSSLSELARSLSPPGVGLKVKARIFEFALALPAEFELALVDLRDITAEFRTLLETDWTLPPPDPRELSMAGVSRRVARVLIQVPSGPTSARDGKP